MSLINCCWLKYPGQKRVTSVGILPWIFSGIKSKYLRGYQFGEIMLIHIVSKWLKFKSSSKITGPGTSVAVQWLKLCTLNAVSMSSTPSQGTKILHALQHFLKKKKKIHRSPLKYTWASLVAQILKNIPAMQETQVQSWVRKIPWRRAWQPTAVFLL